MRKVDMRFKFFIFLILLLVNLKVNAQELGFTINDNRKSVKIPFQIYNNLIVVPVILNNKIPLKFIIDTGVRTSILTQKTFSDLLGLTYSKKYHISGIGENKYIEAYITNNVNLKLPGITGRGHAMLVLNEDYLELRNHLGTDVHGILGYELFSRFIVKIDYDNRVMTLTTPENFKKRRRYKTIPISVEDTKPYVYGEVKFDTREPVLVKLLIDTGASHGLILDEDSDESLFAPEPKIEANLGKGLGGNVYGQISRIESFKLGEMKWKNPLATFPENDQFLDSLKYQGVDRNGSIGGEILGRLDIIFNFPEEVIYVKKGRSFKEDFTYNLSGLSVKAKGSRLNNFEITDVRKNSVGEEAGLKEGDLILSINGMALRYLDLNSLINMLNSKPKKRIKLRVQRKNELLDFKFRLKQEI